MRTKSSGSFTGFAAEFVRSRAFTTCAKPQRYKNQIPSILKRRNMDIEDLKQSLEFKLPARQRSQSINGQDEFRQFIAPYLQKNKSNNEAEQVLASRQLKHLLKKKNVCFASEENEISDTLLT